MDKVDRSTIESFDSLFEFEDNLNKFDWENQKYFNIEISTNNEEAYEEIKKEFPEEDLNDFDDSLCFKKDSPNFQREIKNSSKNGNYKIIA